MEKFKTSVKEPKNFRPDFGLPRWKITPIESKIPQIYGVIYSRGKLGKKLWIDSREQNFITSDPYNLEVPMTYDSLHDEHLATFLQNLVNKQRLIGKGFVTKNLDVECSLRDYNYYRNHLRITYARFVKAWLKKEDGLLRAKLDIKKAEMQRQNTSKK